VLAIGQLGTVLGALALGFLADRFGRRAVIVGAVLAFGCFTLAMPFTASVLALAATRFLACLALEGSRARFIR
jgi:AAHS family 4-hydroxybenzoate transporter-like MFS transporter